MGFMNEVSILVAKLNGIIELESTVPLETLGSYIVGELLGDYDGTYAKLNETNLKVQKIGDLASDIEISNGTPDQLSYMWGELKQLVQEISKEKFS
jgi:hypothetical protein